MLLSRAKEWARSIKRDVIALWLAGKDSRTPWLAKALAIAVAAYALSPIDLIPDFIPILGYLDDLLIVPLGIVAVVALIPPLLMEEFRRNALAVAQRPVSHTAAAFIATIWLLLFAAFSYLSYVYLRGS